MPPYRALNTLGFFSFFGLRLARDGKNAHFTLRDFSRYEVADAGVVGLRTTGICAREDR